MLRTHLDRLVKEQLLETTRIVHEHRVDALSRAIKELDTMKSVMPWCREGLVEATDAIHILIASEEAIWRDREAALVAALEVPQ